jgi:hypothetical protein
VAFYCVADARYFLGAVGMINSLRLQGHTEPVFLLDRGLTSEQRELLSPEVRLVPHPDHRPPFLAKSIAPLSHPASVRVLIDTDMIVTRPLAGLIASASEGRMVAFRDRQQRFFPEWGEVLELGAPRPGPYVSSGLVFLGGSLGDEVLGLMEELHSRVDFGSTFWRGNVRDYPFLYADQDVLNAILSTRVEADRVIALQNRLAANPPYRGLRMVDEYDLRCAYSDGTEPFVLHQYVRKPWLERMYHGIYSRLLARLLLAPDVAVRVPESAVPLRMRRGVRAALVRKAVDLADLTRWYLRDVVPERVAALGRREAPKGP